MTIINHFESIYTICKEKELTKSKLYSSQSRRQNFQEIDELQIQRGSWDVLLYYCTTILPSERIDFNFAAALQ